MPRQSKTKLTAVGIDPGFAKQGVAVLEYDGTTLPRMVHGSVTVTKPPPKKSKVRATLADKERLEILLDALDVAASYTPDIVVIEAYIPHRAQGGGAWKVGLSYGMSVGWGILNGFRTVPRVPQDVKRCLLGRPNGGKEEVEEAVILQTVDTDKFLDGIKPKSLREHLADAAGFAYWGILELGGGTLG